MKDVNLNVFNMITRTNGTKTLMVKNVLHINSGIKISVDVKGKTQ